MLGSGDVLAQSLNYQPNGAAKEEERSGALTMAGFEGSLGNASVDRLAWGALRAGCAAAFIALPGKALFGTAA